MPEKTFSIPNITCGHCVLAIKKEVSAQAGVKSVTGDSAAKSITVAWEAPATEDQIRSVLQDINYPAA